MIRFLRWFFSKSQKPIVEKHIDVYQKFLELEEKYQGLLMDVRRLEEENIENTNLIYELNHSLDAVDRRIDILADEWKGEPDV
jgi:hypothetical protein